MCELLRAHTPNIVRLDLSHNFIGDMDILYLLLASLPNLMVCL